MCLYITRYYPTLNKVIMATDTSNGNGQSGNGNNMQWELTMNFKEFNESIIDI